MALFRGWDAFQKVQVTLPDEIDQRSQIDTLDETLFIAFAERLTDVSD